jgi:uncharacterized protein
VAAYFFDSSAIVKRYVQETGTAWVRRLVRGGKPDLIILARITEVEMTSAVARRRRGGSLTAARVRSILTRFRSHLAGRYIAAVQLAAALEVNGRYQSAGSGGITLVSADQELNAASAASGLVVEDPNAHP